MTIPGSQSEADRIRAELAQRPWKEAERWITHGGSLGKERQASGFSTSDRIVVRPDRLRVFEKFVNSLKSFREFLRKY